MKNVAVVLKSKDKKTINSLIKKGETKDRTINRCHILLLSSQGKGPTFISEVIGCTKKTIHNVKNNFLEGGLERAIFEAPRPGAPDKFSGKHRAKITALACSEAPKGYAKWSLKLLANKAIELGIVEDISHTHVGRILKKTK